MHRREALGLQLLYGEGVLPQELLDVFNNRIWERTHVCIVGTDPAKVFKTFKATQLQSNPDRVTNTEF